MRKEKIFRAQEYFDPKIALKIVQNRDIYLGFRLYKGDNCQQDKIFRGISC